MLEKYLNKEVIIEEKLYDYPSTRHQFSRNSVEGTMTSYDEDFVELDKSSIIARKFIYRIILK